MTQRCRYSVDQNMCEVFCKKWNDGIFNPDLDIITLDIDNLNIDLAMQHFNELFLKVNPRLLNKVKTGEPTLRSNGWFDKECRETRTEVRGCLRNLNSIKRITLC